MGAARVWAQGGGAHVTTRATYGPQPVRVGSPGCELWLLEHLPCPPARPQVRLRTSRAILLGLQALQLSGRLQSSVVDTVVKFLIRCLPPRTVLAIRSSLEAAEAEGPAMLAHIGHLPLDRLLQLHALLSIRLAGMLLSPADLLRPMQVGGGARRLTLPPHLVLAGCGRGCSTGPRMPRPTPPPLLPPAAGVPGSGAGRVRGRGGREAD